MDEVEQRIKKKEKWLEEYDKRNDELKRAYKSC
jgi:hypothetical protein